MDKHKITLDKIVPQKEAVHHPDHYNIHKYECIVEMIAVFGIQAVMDFCKINVWKYRYRTSAKNGKEDEKKADEYMDILIKLQNGEPLK